MQRRLSFRRAVQAAFALAATLAAALATGAPRALGAQVTESEYAGRRVALAADLPSDGVIVALGADEPEEDYLSVWQRPDFLYRTGLREPSAAMVLVRRNGRTTTTLFVQPRDPSREAWTGTRLGAAGATRLTGVPARTRDALEPALDSLLAAGLPLYVAGPLAGSPPPVGAPATDEDRLVARLRARHPRIQVSGIGGTVRRHGSRRGSRQRGDRGVAQHRRGLRTCARGRSAASRPGSDPDPASRCRPGARRRAARSARG